ncbi:MAG TPA: aminotransferase class V-fold PLP-dependent enzyme, partial [Acidimicrobiales bacterium]|nr:aminotransferase class V-fold PLP-dependent enzyme [Acidimicrobiales bacterium]
MRDRIDDPVLTDDDVAWLRRMLPATEAGAYLNTGTAGPLPTPAVEAMRDEIEIQLTLPRSGPEHLDRYLALAAEDRSAIASLLHAQPSEIALTHSTTEGMSLVTMGIGWRHGDEAVTTNLEHPGVLFPLCVARDRFGVEVRRLDLDGLSDSDIVEALTAAVSPRTRLVSISHVSFQNGQVLPIRAIADAIGGDSALLLVDGAQSYGALDIDVTSLGADAYAVPGQKWQLGPEGTGGLYCRPEIIEDLSVTMASYGTVESYTATDFVPHRDARRLEFGTTNTIGWVGQISAISFLSETVGLA